MANPGGRGGYKKGQSGNPGGRPHALVSVMAEARKHTLEAISVLSELMRSANSESVRLNARSHRDDILPGSPIGPITKHSFFSPGSLSAISGSSVVLAIGSRL